MLSRVEVITSQGALLNLQLDDDSSSFIVQEMTGLEPVKATLVSSSFANSDGEQYHSSRREARNITIKFGLEPDYAVNSIADLRNQLYSFFMPKTQVTLRFHLSDLLYVDILGRVESFEAPLFTDTPEVDISLMCFDPDFFDPNSGLFTGMSTSGLDEVQLTYNGTVDTGLLFTLSPNRPVTDFSIYHRPPDGTLRVLDFSYPLLDKDVLKINTVFGAKAITLTRAGVDTSQLYSMSPQSNWLRLQPGVNNLRVYTTGAAIPYTISYVTRYGGL